MNFEKWEIPVFVHLESQSTVTDLGGERAVSDLPGHVQPVFSCGSDVLWGQATGGGNDGVGGRGGVRAGSCCLPPPASPKNSFFKYWKHVRPLKSA